MGEIGIAIALGKPIFLFRDDFRKCTDSNVSPLNLIIFNGVPTNSWEDCSYLDEVECKNKAIYQ